MRQPHSSARCRADQTGALRVHPQHEFERPLLHVAYLMRAMAEGDRHLEKVAGDELRLHGYELIDLGRREGGPR